MSIIFTIAGPNAEALATEIEAFVAEALDKPAARCVRQEQQGLHRGELDPIAVAALVLAIPGAITATLDIVTRARLAERIDRLLKRLRGAASPEDSVHLASGTASSLDLISAGRDAVLNRLEEAADEAANGSAGE